MKKTLSLLWLCALLLMAGSSAWAASTTKPVYRLISGYSDYAVVQAMSDNGEWALLAGPTGEYRANGRAKLIKVSDYTNPIYLESTAGTCDVADVTNDGNIVVGAYNGLPAYLNRTTGSWTTLPLPSDFSTGECSAVTPDGKYAVGTVYGETDIYTYDGCVWDLTTGKIVELPNAPQGDTSSKLNVQYQGISADGRYVVIQTNFSYPPAQVYIYDIQNSTYVRPGYEKTASGIYKPVDDNLNELTDASISPNGKYLSATARILDGDLDEYVTTMLYDVTAGTSTIFTETSDKDIVPSFVDNNGHVYGCSPSANPVREWAIRVGNFWYAYDDITSQVYGQDFYRITNLDNTGTPTALSVDGKTFASMVDPAGGGAYIAIFPEDLAEVCKQIDLLSNYSATPADSTILTSVSKIEVLFDRDIKALGANNCVSIKDESGNVVRQSLSGGGFAVDQQNSKNLIISFRSTTFEKGKNYTVEIPAGAVALKADETHTNGAITLHYTGRGTQAVQVTATSPEDHAKLARIDNSNNAVYLVFDAQITATDTASAQLVRTSDNTVISDLSVVTLDKRAQLAPTATQYLYDGQEYKVVLKAGSVTDLSGKGANEEYSLNLHGTYVREITTKSDTIFFDGFQNTNNSLATWLRYEGDHLTPTDEMAALTFDADNQPWNFTIRESQTSSDNCAASHSMYSPAGQSDDWMLTPQIPVTDANYMLYFDAQSYREAKHDTLKVVVWATDQNLSYLSADNIAQMKSEGTVVFNECLTPGLTEEDLSGDWTRYSISLAPYVGKNIYIGFWNNNNDQSAIFVDNVLIQDKVKYTLALTNAESVVAQESSAVKGRLTVKDADATYSTVKLTLKDAAGKTVSTYSKSGLSLKNNSRVDFAFEKELPLTIGEVNDFTIDVQLDDYTGSTQSSIRDLAFQPEQFVVLEEQTGIGCVYCPLGIQAIEHLKSIYGRHFLPVSLHTYSGDPYGTGQSSYATALFSGDHSAPIARINRNSYIAAPMTVSLITGEYVFSDGSGQLWSELVAAEFDAKADMELTIGGITIDEENQVFSLNDVAVKSALNLNNQDLGIFIVVMEDSIVATQANGLYEYSDVTLGDWGKGQKYGFSSNNGVVHNDVSRAAYGSDWTSGTTGFFPQSLTAGSSYTTSITDITLPQNVFELKNCKAVVMLLDANTGLVINANYIYFDDDRQAAGIKGVAEDTVADGDIVARYSLDGRMLSAPQKGINIVRYANGKTMKVVVK